MQEFTFIHAADLHLDAVLPAPAGGNNSELQALLAGAVFSALGRLVDLCIAEKAAFLLLAGDVFHGGAGSLKAASDMREACARLMEHGIEVFWVHGNHDSLSQSAKAKRWPANLHIFGVEAERLAVSKNGVVIAEIHGLSHKSKHERANLAERITKDKNPTANAAAFSIGLLHCAVNGAQGKHIAYAPCSLSDLTGGGKDYWALGHVHSPALLANDPLVVYPGSLQGLHVNEAGPHGCYVVRVSPQGRAQSSFQAQARFQPLAPVHWAKLSLDLAVDDLNSPHALKDGVLEDAALEQIQAFADELMRKLAGDPLNSLTSERLNNSAGGQLHKFTNEQLSNFAGELGSTAALPELLLLRLELTGRTMLDAQLREPKSLAELALRLNAALALLGAALPLAVRIKDIGLGTSPDIDLTALMQSDNLVGETLRKAMEVADTLERLAAAGVSDFAALEGELKDLSWGADFLTALASLYKDKRLGQAEALPSVAELAAMAREAASLCLHHFEVEA